MKLKKILLMAIGLVSLLIGAIGIVLPILPTTPFVLMAAACFASSNENMYRWLSSSKYFGEFIKNYRENTGIALATKRRALLFLWITLPITAILIGTLVMYLVLLVIGIGVTTHIVRIKTKKT